MKSAIQDISAGELYRLNSSSHYFLRTGYLIDGRGGPVQADQFIEIDQGRIVSVRPGRTARRGSGKVIDLSRCTLLPALMDAHVHLAFSGTLNTAARQTQLRPGGTDAQSAIARHCRDQLNNGIVAVRDAGDRGGAVLAAKASQILPIHVAATCWAWHAPGRYGGMIGRTPVEDGDLGRAVTQAPHNLDHIKIINSGINSIDSFGHRTDPQFSREQLARVCRWAKNEQLPMMVHANGPEAVRIGLAAGCDSIEHGYFMGSENLRRMADAGTVWVPTAYPMAALAVGPAVTAIQAGVARRTLDHQLQQIGLAAGLGVRIALGTDAGSMGVDHGVAVRRELSLLMEAGLTLAAAIRCATLNVARLMGLPRQGAVRPGWSADLIAVKGRPQELPDRLNTLHAICCKGRWSHIQG